MASKTEVLNAINDLFEAMIEDYTRWTNAYPGQSGEVAREQIEVYKKGLGFDIGKKYIRIKSNGSAWGFVVLVDDDKKFRQGDLLKAAGFVGPSKNRSRGNVLTKDFSWVQWTGLASV